MAQFSDSESHPHEALASAGVMLALTEDPAQQQELAQCALQLGLKVRFVGTGTDLLQVLADHEQAEPLATLNNTGSTLKGGERYSMLVLAGHVPTWVHLDLVMRLKSGLARGRHYRSGILMPIMFLSQDGQLKLVMDQISRGLLADFMQLPIRQEELLIRAQALLERWDMVASVSESAQSEAVNDASDSVFDALAGGAETRVPQPPQELQVREIDLPNGDKIWGEYRLSPSQSTAMVGDKLVHLTNREFVVAWTLFNALGNVVTREDLRAAMAKRHRNNKEIMNRSLDAYICRVRVLLNLAGEGSMSLMPVYRVGYVVRPNRVK